MRFGIASTVVLCLGENVAAYSDMGHRTVALLAHEYLSSEAVEFYDGILANDLGFGFDDAATWADVVKRKRPYTKTWHYIGKFFLTIFAELSSDHDFRCKRCWRGKRFGTKELSSQLSLGL